MNIDDNHKETEGFSSKEYHDEEDRAEKYQLIKKERQSRYGLNKDEKEIVKETIRDIIFSDSGLDELWDSLDGYDRDTVTDYISELIPEGD